MTKLIAATLAGFIGAFATMHGPKQDKAKGRAGSGLELGNFSVSLVVKDLAASRAFYEKLGFRQACGPSNKRMVILQNDTATIGLFQGVLQRNTLTFNPGWDRHCGTLPAFDDVRDIQKALKSQGLTPTTEADATSTGPAFLMLADPDGNPVFIDQHVPKPGK